MARVPVVVTASVPGPALQRAVLGAVADHLTAALRGAAPAVGRRVGEEAVRLVQGSPAYLELVGGGRLRHELGPVDPVPVLEAVCRNLRAGVRVAVDPVRAGSGGLSGGMTVELLKGDYSEVLGAPGAAFASEGGHPVEWLRWLTLGGERAAVLTRRFVPVASPRSRTGLGLMVPPGSWRVPAEHAGTAADNWLTRALAGLGPAFERAVADEVGGRL